ncbi:MAG TPA: ShlB/FhaC/HecB family hemolysin secretion/activation protein [Gemmatimonadales bacterium]
MLALLVAALLQGTAPAAATVRPDTVARDTAAAPPAAQDSTRPRRRSRRVALTAEHLRTAFDDAAARELFQRARATRLRQDTALVAYDATTFQRISAGLGIRRFGRERLLFRQEEATRVRWVRGQGVVVDVLGRRQAVPSGEGRLQLEVDVGGNVGPIPYFPGQETLWLGSSDVAKAEVDDHGPVHPLADGAEAYYRYRSGDSVTVRLQTGRTITLRELEVRPREPRWDLAVGSLWFDVSNAQLVRGVYRLSVPIEIWQVVEESGEDDDVPGWVKTLVNPLRATVSAVTVEYGLEGGGFWLPRLQAMEAEAEAGFMRIPVRFEQSYRYASVNGTFDALPPIPEARDDSLRQIADSAWRDTLRALPSAQRDSARAARMERMNPCSDDSVRTYAGSRFDGALRTLVRVPCDTTLLLDSPALPPSIFAEGEELFDARLQEALVDAALSLGAQSDWAPQRPVVKWGLGDGLLRYNRVEGLSPAVAVEQQLGRGYQARAVARIGTADLQPNAELGLTRTDGRRTLGVNVYRRLAAANDWGEPLGLSSSLSAVLFGRDEGFYYRSWGAEISGLGRGTRLGEGDFAWRLFSERHDAVDVETRFGLFDRMAQGNIAAAEGSVTGMGARWVRTFGLDPRGVRALADVRGEGGVGSFGYGRALADVTVSSPLVARVDGALTLSAGSSVGTVPIQRAFFLGGPHTVRGQDPGAAVGDAYWMARVELARNTPVFRPVVFYDVGWAGARGDWRHPGRPMSGAGAGVSILDGLFRLDLSRGIRPEEQWRVDMYLEARF